MFPVSFDGVVVVVVVLRRQQQWQWCTFTQVLDTVNFIC
jgi:hypothetical protein